MNPFSDMARELSGFDNPDRGSVKVRSIDAFMAVLSKQVDLVPAEPKDLKTATFCGVDVHENEYVPAGMAILMQGNEIVNIIRFAEVGV